MLVIPCWVLDVLLHSPCLPLRCWSFPTTIRQFLVFWERFPVLWTRKTRKSRSSAWDTRGNCPRRPPARGAWPPDKAGKVSGPCSLFAMLGLLFVFVSSIYPPSKKALPPFPSPNLWPHSPQPLWLQPRRAKLGIGSSPAEGPRPRVFFRRGRLRGAAVGAIGLRLSTPERWGDLA